MWPDRVSSQTRYRLRLEDSVDQVSVTHDEQPYPEIRCPTPFLFIYFFGSLTLFLSSRPAHPYHLDESISSFRRFWWMFSFLLYMKFLYKFL